jgi:hypothetical protein
MVATRVHLLTALFILAVPCRVGASLIVVPDQYPTIQAAINSAAHGDSIKVRAGTYVEALTLSHKDLTLFGESGAEATVITTNFTSRVFDIGADVSLATILSDLTFHQGNANEGGGIRLKESASPTIRRCRFTANRSFVPEESSRGGGMLVGSESHPVIEDCLFLDNIADYFCCWPPGYGMGGAIAVASGAQPRVLRTVFTNNGAAGFEGGFGGGIHVAASAFAFIQQCTFQDSQGGGIGSNGNITVKECTFTGNVAYVGAAIGSNGGQCLIEESLFFDNEPWGEGGTLYVFGTGEIRNNTVAFNGLEHDPNVGGVSVGPGVAMRNNIVAGNKGVGVYCDSQSPSSNACNDVWNNSRGNYFTQCDRTGIDGNVSLDPQFCDEVARDLTISAQSPCVPHGSCGLIGALGIGCGVEGVAEGEGVATQSPRLLPPSPNPAHSPATILFELPARAPVQLRIYDAAGRQVVMLADRTFDAGQHEIAWSGRSADGRDLASGVYFLELVSYASRHIERLVLIH